MSDSPSRKKSLERSVNNAVLSSDPRLLRRSSEALSSSSVLKKQETVTSLQTGIAQYVKKTNAAGYIDAPKRRHTASVYQQIQLGSYDTFMSDAHKREATPIKHLQQKVKGMGERIAEMGQEKKTHTVVDTVYDQVKEAIYISDHSHALDVAKKEALSKRMRMSVYDMTNTIKKLDQVFIDLATLEEKRSRSAILIGKCMRGYLVRKRFRHFKAALATWRKRYAGTVVSSLTQFQIRQDLITQSLLRYEKMANIKILTRYMASWFRIALLNLPLKRKRREEVEKRFQRRQKIDMKLLLRGWLATATGPRSRKKLVENHLDRMLDARKRLESLQKYKVISNDMVHEEMSKHIVRTIRDRRVYHIQHTALKALYHDVVQPLMASYAVADNHFNLQIRIKCFTMWTDVWKRRIDRHDGMVSAKRGFDTFTRARNTRKFDHFHFTKVMGNHFTAWKDAFIKNKEVRRRYEAHTQKNLRHVLRAFRIRTTYQIQVRKSVVAEWKGYSNRIYLVPLRAWFVYAIKRRARRSTQEALSRAYARKRRRQVMYSLFRCWKHLTAYGKVDGVHSRVELIQTLENQKRYCLSLEENCVLYKDNIAQLEDRIEHEQTRTIDKQGVIEEQVTEQQERTLALHNAQTQISLLQSLVKAIGQVHPDTVTKFQDYLQREKANVLNSDVLDLAELQTTMLHMVRCGKARTDSDDDDACPEDDKMILRRARWALTRMDLSSMEISTRSQRRLRGQQQLSDENDPLSKECEQLYSLFEFIRTGDTGPLLPQNRPDRKRSKVALENQTDLTTPVVVPSRDCVKRPDLISTTPQWKDFLNEIVYNFPPRKSQPIQERLMKRIARNNNN